MAGRGQATDADRERLSWWREARFGLFIHWGLYSIPAGVWRGQTVKGIGEWIMYNHRIPVSDYERLAGGFNPVKFDADEWVSVAKQAGMRYIVITAKHHDGFAMFKSPSSAYNIVDTTPFERDPMHELAEACRKAGIRLCFYYSQDQDWHDPNGAWNDWDFNEEKKSFEAYLHGKCIPQVTELLTQYGPIGLIWFDTPYTIGQEHSMQLRRLVHNLQPDCLVSGRIGNDLGDYGSLGDNQIPVGPVDGDYETPATMNNTWGFRSDDENWKSSETLLYLLIDLAAKGINYLLNVGPTADGTIPRASIERLKEIGEWTGTNGEAIYGTDAGPFPYELKWGRITTKGHKLYLIFFEWPQRTFHLHGLKSKIIRAYPLTSPQTALDVTQQFLSAAGVDTAKMDGFGEAPVGAYPVIVLELGGNPIVDTVPLQQPDGTVALPSFMAQIYDPDKKGTFKISRSGFTDEWQDPRATVSWSFKATKPGRYRVEVLSAAPITDDIGKDSGEPIDQPPHRITVALSASLSTVASFKMTLLPDEKVSSPRAQYFPEIISHGEIVALDAQGLYDVKITPDFIEPTAENGLAISGVRLVPA